MSFKKLLAFSFATGAVAVVASPAWAQGASGIEEIIVTAEKR
jgi:hypothetical protein